LQTLESKGVKVGVFPTPSEALLFGAGQASFAVSSISELIDRHPLRAEVQPVCQNGDPLLACFLSGQEVLFSFQRWGAVQPPSLRRKASRFNGQVAIPNGSGGVPASAGARKDGEGGGELRRLPL